MFELADVQLKLGGGTIDLEVAVAITATHMVSPNRPGGNKITPQWGGGGGGGGRCQEPPLPNPRVPNLDLYCEL